MSAARPGRKQHKRSATIVLLGVAVFLLALFQYLWTYNYKPRRLADPAATAASLRASLAVVEHPIDGSPVLCARLTLSNAGKERLTLLDCADADLLYGFEVQKRLPDRRLETLPRKPHFASMAEQDAKGPLVERMTEVTLLPQRSVEIYLPLTPDYNLRGANGTYNVVVHYQPEAALKLLDPRDAEAFSVHALALACQTDFELPLAAPLPTSTPRPAARDAEKNPVPVKGSK